MADSKVCRMYLANLDGVALLGDFDVHYIHRVETEAYSDRTDFIVHKDGTDVLE